MSEARHTRRLADLRLEHGGTFGGKSSTLGELIAAEIPVPPGFALDTTAFRAFVAEAGLEGVDRLRDGKDVARRRRVRRRRVACDRRGDAFRPDVRRRP